MPKIIVYDTGRRMTTKFTLAFDQGIVEPQKKTDAAREECIF